jgi:hypothetical protein
MQCRGCSRSSDTNPSLAVADQQADAGRAIVGRACRGGRRGAGSQGVRFARFAAAMEADPASRDQLFGWSQRRIRPAETVNTSSRIQWLGIGSWALFCAALLVSLLLRPHQVSLELDQIHPRTLASDVRPIADSVPTTRGLLPGHGQEVALTAPAPAPDLHARPADQETLPGDEADHQ